MEELLLMENITKSYDGCQALKNGRIDVKPSEIHALIGANGAGKSTLMKILYGITHSDGGDVYFDGKKVKFKNVREAQSVGIFMLHQELQVVKDLTVAQNIFLGQEKKRGVFLDDREMIATSWEILKAVGLEVNPMLKMEDLSPAEQRLTQIAAVLIKKPKLIILDEPTTSFGEKDVKTLFSLMRKFKESGISMIFISHRLDELFEISDRITVMRDGCFVVCENTSKMSKNQLVYYMTGKEVNLTEKTESAVLPNSPIVLDVKNLCTAEYLNDVNFYLRKGEILGFAGLMGSGRTEVARAICGLDKKSAGSITINGETVEISCPIDAARYGMGYLSENRNEEGVIYGKNIIFNTAISSLEKYSGKLLLNDKEIINDAMKFNERVGTVSPDFFGAIENLSGGNRQKVLIARTLMKDMQIIIFDEPTSGIDVGAKEDIYEIIKDLAQEGHSLIVISSQTEEIRALCDRVMVMYEGSTVGELKAGDLSNAKIMYYATGMKNGNI